MNNAKRLSQAIDELISCGEAMTKALCAIKHCLAEEQPEEKNDDIPAYTREDVRGILASKAFELNGRFRKQVKEIVSKYSTTGNLAGVDEKDLAKVVKEAMDLNRPEDAITDDKEE